MTENRSLSTQLQQLGIQAVTYRALQDLHPGANAGSLMMVLRYCKAARLDPLRSPVVVLPIDGKQVPVLSINGLRAHAVRTGQYAGGYAEFSDNVEDIDGVSLPTWCRYVVGRITNGGSRVEFSGQVWSREVIGRTKAGKPTRIWQTRPMHMLQIAAERLALRRGFPESVPPDDVIQEREQIDPNTGEIYGEAPRHLSDEDIAAGLDSIEGIESAADSHDDWVNEYDSA